MTEPQLYNLASSGNAQRDAIGAREYAQSLMIIHLNMEHGMGVREIAKRFKIKTTQVSSILKKYINEHDAHF